MTYKILIIDDNDLIRYTTSLLVKQLGLDPTIAYSGIEGLEIAKLLKPDVILLDIMMPGIDGWEVLERLAADPDLKDIPVILFTALEEQLFPKNASLHLAKGVLQKPFHLEELTAALKMVISLEVP